MKVTDYLRDQIALHERRLVALRAALDALAPFDDDAPAAVTGTAGRSDGEALDHRAERVAERAQWTFNAIAAFPGVWEDLHLAEYLELDREEIALATGALLNAGRIRLTPEGTWTTADEAEGP